MKFPVHKYKKAIDSAATEEVASRDAATLVSGILNVLPNPDPVLRKTGKRLETYRNLEADWEVGSAIELVHGGLQDLEWQLEQGDADKKAFNDFKERFKDWDIQKILSECVDGRNMGYQPFEFMWNRDADVWFVENIIGKPPEWFNFNQQNQLQFKSTSNRLGEAVQPYKFGCAQHRETYNNPYGQALLSKCFWPVAFKKGGIEFWTKFLEKYSIPWVVGKQPRGAGKPAKNKLLADLSNMVQDAVAVIPDDSSIDIQEASGKAASTDAFSSYAWYFDAAINKVILSSETAMSVSKEGSDVRGSGKEHAEASKKVINAIGGMAEQVVNQAIKWEWHFNHEGPAPVFSIFEPKAVQKDRAERDTNLTGQGVRFNKQYYINRYGFSEDEFEVTDPGQNQGPEFNQASEGGRVGQPATRNPQHGKGCQCGSCRINISGSAAPRETTFNQESNRNQRVIEEIVEGIGGEDAAATNQQIMETIMEPVLELFEQADDMEEVMQQLAAQFPEMDTAQLEQRLTSVLFLADTWGRLTAQDEEEDE